MNAILIYQPDTRSKEITNVINRIKVLGIVTTQILSPTTSGAIFAEILYKRPNLLIFVKSEKDNLVREFLFNVRVSTAVPSIILTSQNENGLIAKNLETLRNVEVFPIPAMDKNPENIIALRIAKLFTKPFEALNSKKKMPSYIIHEAKEKLESSNLEIKSVEPSFDRKFGLYQPSTNKLPPTNASKEFEEIILIGASAGGPEALTELLQYLPAEFPPIVIVQHIAEKFVKLFATRLDSITALKVLIAEDGDVIKTNHIYIAPGGFHVEFDKINRWHRILLKEGKKVNQARPSVDVLFSSGARVFQDKLIAIILTGTGHDGRDGAKKVKQYGGHILAQNEASSIAYGMNKAVIDQGLADEIIDISVMAGRVLRTIRERKRERKELNTIN